MYTRVFRRGDLDSDHRLVIVTLHLKLEKRSSQRRGKRFYTALLGKMEMRLEYVEALRKSFNDRTQEGSVEERWSKLRKPLWDQQSNISEGDEWQGRSGSQMTLLSWLN